MLNGALILCTMDGACVEIVNEVGRENIFVFGMSAQQGEELRAKDYNPIDMYNSNPDLKLCLDQIKNGYFTPAAENEFEDLIDRLLCEDKNFVLADYADYIRAQDSVSETFEVKDFQNCLCIVIQMIKKYFIWFRTSENGVRQSFETSLQAVNFPLIAPSKSTPD